MIRNLIVSILIISYSSVTFATFDVRKFIDTTDAKVTRVRTPEERDQRWQELAVLDFIGLVEQFPGYTAEEYDVETKDGYILKLHRISGSPSKPKKIGKPVVYMGHCLCCSSDMYVVTGPKHSLAFQLADAGYDVWIGNYRGNTYSGRHKKYSASAGNFKFWNFSLDEMALIDLPLFIDTVLEKTNQKKLSYVGFSMGTTTIYMLLSTKPKYNDKMNVVVSMAPVAIFTRPFSLFVEILLLFAPAIKDLFLNHKIYQVFHQSKIIQLFVKNICVTPLGRKFCKFLLNTLVSSNFLHANAIPTLLSHVPAGTSLNTIEHYFQLMRSGQFRHFDYGVALNKNKYGTPVPPEYDLTKISSPQAIFYSEQDVFTSRKDINNLGNKFQNVVAFERTPYNFNHLDYVWHRDARKYVYNPILKILAQIL